MATRNIGLRKVIVQCRDVCVRNWRALDWAGRSFIAGLAVIAVFALAPSRPLRSVHDTLPASCLGEIVCDTAETNEARDIAHRFAVQYLESELPDPRLPPLGVRPTHWDNSSPQQTTVFRVNDSFHVKGWVRVFYEGMHPDPYWYVCDLRLDRQRAVWCRVGIAGLE
jgi:hypothetical protein